MCGIAGILSKEKARLPKEWLLSMAGELHHRGPDGVGLYLDQGVGLVNTRLSIIDLSGGDQPIGNEDGRFWAVQNGEIYNHIELRAELESLGHRFTTHSDTEVIVHAFEEWGTDCLHHFNGAFALAVWDRMERRLFLGRDRFGIRPLFLANPGGDLVFASEAKAILRHPKAARALDLAGIVDTFTLWGSLPDKSAFQGIRELPPGCWLSATVDGKVTQQQWWDLTFEVSDTRRRKSEAELAEELAWLLTDAIRLRLRADVPVGAYLSGGLDSSTIVGMAREEAPDRLRCFGISFSDSRFDESPHQRRVAELLGIDLTQILIDSGEIAERFPEVIRLAEKPILRTSPAPMLALAGLVRESGFKVVMTGEGADEIFSGYDLFREAQVRRFWARQPESQRRSRLFERLYPWLTRSTSENPAFSRQFFGAGLTNAEDPLYSHRIRLGTTARLLRFLSADLLREQGLDATSPERDITFFLPEGFHAASDLAKAQILEIKTFLHGYLLHSQGDRMLMGRSVEGRFPFLDYRVAEFAASLPDGMRQRGLKDKRILRRTASRVLPPDVTQRPKRPYRAPIINAFIGPEAPDYASGLFEEQRLAETGVFSPSTARLLWNKCLKNVSRGDQGVSEMDEMAFVGVLSIQLLHEQFIRDPEPAPALLPNRMVVGDKEWDLSRFSEVA